MAFTAVKGERTSTEDEAVRTASGARIETEETVFAVRQRYSGQSGVEQAFALRAFSLLHASQHALVDASGACAPTNDERPVNMKSTTTRSARLTVFIYDDCIAALYSG